MQSYYFNDYFTIFRFRLLLLCWSSSESRPTTTQIDLMLTDLLHVYKHTKINNKTKQISDKDFDERWKNFKPNSKITVDTFESISEFKKPLSISLSDIHGSVDNLLNDSQKCRSVNIRYQKEALSTEDLSYLKGFSDAMNDLDNAIALEDISNTQSTPADVVQDKLKFELEPFDIFSKLNTSIQVDNFNDSFINQKNSSGSETEDENWKSKIERGAYSEKVRLKSRSVADLMVLTHIDCSESDSETPMPSLDYRTNYKNVRFLPKQNLENTNIMFGSEGNLLSVKDTFEQELKMLREKRRDSLLFVPESNNTKENKNATKHDESHQKMLIDELNNPSKIKPANQIYNVFNVTTATNISPKHIVKMDEIINLKKALDEYPFDIKKFPNEITYINNKELLSPNIITEVSPITRSSNLESFEIKTKDLKENYVLSKEQIEICIDCENSANNILTEKQKESDKQPILLDIISNDKDEINSNLKVEVQKNIDSNLHSSAIEISKSFLLNETKYSNSDYFKYNISKCSGKIIKNIFVKDTKSMFNLNFLIESCDLFLKNEITKCNEQSLKLNTGNTQECNFSQGLGFTSTPLNKSNNESSVIIGPWEDYTLDLYSGLKTIHGPFIDEEMLQFSSNFTLENESSTSYLADPNLANNKGIEKQPVKFSDCILENQVSNLKTNYFDSIQADVNKSDLKHKDENMTYSLETWDKFLVNVLERQSSEEKEIFDNYNSEPLSLLFFEEDEVNSFKVSSKKPLTSNAQDLLNKDLKYDGELKENKISEKPCHTIETHFIENTFNKSSTTPPPLENCVDKSNFEENNTMDFNETYNLNIKPNDRNLGKIKSVF